MSFSLLATIRVNTFPYFLSRRKKGGTYRMILNLKGSNRNVDYYHFKMDIILTVLRLLTQAVTRHL